MSLYRQLIGVISAVILLLVSLWIIISIHSDKSTLIKQMQTQAQNGRHLAGYLDDRSAEE